MWCHLTRIELFYSDDNFRRIALWVSAFSRKQQDFNEFFFMRMNGALSVLPVLNLVLYAFDLKMFHSEYSLVVHYINNFITIKQVSVVYVEISNTQQVVN